jgi:hypothetical protein
LTFTGTAQIHERLQRLLVKREPTAAHWERVYAPVSVFAYSYQADSRPADLAFSPCEPAIVCSVLPKPIRVAGCVTQLVAIVAAVRAASNIS